LLWNPQKQEFIGVWKINDIGRSMILEKFSPW